jgi:perosamine synthetase
VSKFRIPLARPDIGAQETTLVKQVLSSGVLSRGPMLSQFETLVRERIGTRHAVGTSSGTAALHLALLALELQPGDEVITTPFSVPASINPILNCGAMPILADIDAQRRSLDPLAAASAITPRTRGILAVHAFGQPADVSGLLSLCEQHDLWLLEDSCEALGTRMSDGMLGSFGRIGVFGFYPNKQITTGEGGMAVSNDLQLAERMRLLANHGRTMDGSWLDQHEIGFNYRLSEIQAALGVAQMQRLDDLLEDRNKQVAQYQSLLSNNERLIFPETPADCLKMSWFSLVVQLAEHDQRHDRDRVVVEMAKRGIQLGRYFAPLHLQPALMRALGTQLGDFPRTEAIADRCLALPIYAGLGKAEIQDVCGELLNVLQH